jgi:hypothetical protein
MLSREGQLILGLRLRTRLDSPTLGFGFNRPFGTAR